MYNVYLIKSLVLVIYFSSFLISIYIKKYPACHLSKAFLSRSPTLITLNYGTEILRDFQRVNFCDLKSPILREFRREPPTPLKASLQYLELLKGFSIESLLERSVLYLLVS